MAFKCVNELDKFMFQDAEVKKMELNPGLMTMVLLGVAAKHNNPSNDTLTDRYLDDTELRFKSPVITRFLLEGAKYYDANNVLQREVPDQDIPEEQFKEIFRKIQEDGKLVVFHDFDLKRMCGIHKKLTELTYAELKQYSLKGSTEKIPLFSAVLDLIAGRTPLVVEIKVGYDYKATTEAAAEMLSQYSGVYCMECFNPLALVWYRRHNPKVLRGQLSMDFFHSEDKMPKIVRFFLTNLLLNFCAKPDFISYNHKDRHIRGFRMCRKLFKVKTAAWTIKSQAELEAARGTFDMFIFDSFLPEEGEKVRLS